MTINGFISPQLPWESSGGHGALNFVCDPPLQLSGLQGKYFLPGLLPFTLSTFSRH